MPKLNSGAADWLRRHLVGRPLTTHQSAMPWLSVWSLNFVWFGEVYNALLHGVGVTFVARRLTADPRMIVLASTLGLLFTGTIGPFINYVSDRIWTSAGRRRPIIVFAYGLSAAGLCVIPSMDSITTLLIAVACHACVHSFATPMEPLYMELVPPAQQGRAQAIRHAYIQASVLFFFQVVLVQFDQGFSFSLGWFTPAGGITGVHLAFWLGGAILFLMSLYLAVCTRENPPALAANPRLGTMLRGFPRDVFADWRWWPAYGLYVAPGIVTAVWGSLQPLMVVEQFGFSLTDMARIGLPVSLAGLALFAPLLGYCTDRGRRFPPWQLVLAALLLLGVARLGYQAMPQNTRELPPVLVSLAFCLPLGLAVLCLVLAVVTTLGARSRRLDLRAGFIVVSVAGQLGLAGLAWLWTQALPGARAEMPMPIWLAYLTVSQVLSLAATVTLAPLLFSKIPRSKFGTVSSGFGIFGAMTTYMLGNLGGLWVHTWTGWLSGAGTQYTSLWLLQMLVGLVAVVLVLRCLRSSFMTGGQAQSNSWNHP